MLWLESWCAQSLKGSKDTSPGGFLPEEPGLYGFFLRDEAVLPAPFEAERLWRERPEPRLLYVGRAARSLRQRVWQQEVHNEGPATFFRSVGVMLGYTSCGGGKNFRFANEHKLAISAWITEHLRVTHKPMRDAAQRNAEESAAIRHFRPLLNIRGNPDAFALLSERRALARRGLAVS